MSQAMRLVTNIFAKHMGKEICGYAASFTEELGSISIAIPCYGSWLSSEVLMYLIAGIMTGFFWKALTGMTIGYKSKSSGWMHPKWLHVAKSYGLDNYDHDSGPARNMIRRLPPTSFKISRGNSQAPVHYTFSSILSELPF